MAIKHLENCPEERDERLQRNNSDGETVYIHRCIDCGEVERTTKKPTLRERQAKK